ncbi:oligosaccharide flippase family protein [Candidatus Roizmanbacteria bacterium]|nr:oligosaccharide flippase family protein [Candidatus Roizmanbacteria bacterium]
MEENRELKKKTIVSTISLFFQSGFSAVLGLAANLVLTILLSPAIFGIYITILSMISLLNYFSDIGLAASLIQKKEITNKDVSTTFTIQQILILTLIIVAFSLTPFIIKFYNLPVEGKYLYWSLLLSFFLSSLKTIPSVFLERKIQFQKIVLVQILENTVFYVSVIIFAILGFKLKSFTYAVFFRSIVGLLFIYILSPWVPKVGVEWNHLKRLLKFGVPFQASSFLALFKDDLITLYLGKALGFEGLGYIGWAKKWAEAPIRIIMDNLSRVLFPVIARIQHDKEKISRLVEKILRYQTMILAPSVIGLTLTMNVLVSVIPKYGKWQPAIPLFYIFCLSSLFSSYSTPFMNLFNALGKVKISFTFMAIWTITVWILTILLTPILRTYGFPVAQLILSATFLFVVWQAKRIIRFSYIQPIYKPLLATIFMGISLFLIQKFLPLSILSLGFTIILGVFIYFILLLVLFNINLITEVKSLLTYE